MNHSFIDGIKNQSDLKSSEDNNHYSYQVEQCIIQCRQITHDLLDSFFTGYLKLAKEMLEEVVDNKRTNKEIVLASDNLRELRRQENNIKLKFHEQVNQGFDLFLQKRLYLDLSDSSDDDTILKLVEQEELERSLAIKTIADKCNIEFQDDLWQLEQRFEAMQSTSINEHSNPISPLQFCSALQKSIENTALCNSSVILIYKAFENNFFSFLERLYRSINIHLIKQNILPELNKNHTVTRHTPKEKSFDNSKTQSKEELPPPDEKDQNIDEDQNEEETQLILINAIRKLLEQSQPHQQLYNNTQPFIVTATQQNNQPIDHTNSNVHTSALYNSQEIIHAINNVQAQEAKCISVSNNQSFDDHDIIENKKKIIMELEKNSKNSKMEYKDMYTINLVGILFEFILKDNNIPHPVKTLLSSLHTPFLKLAFIDVDFFEKLKHPARLLLDELAEMGSTWVNNDGSDQYDVYNKIKSVVLKIMEEFINDISFFDEILLDFKKFKKNIKNRHDIKERNIVERIQGEERLRMAKYRAKEEIEDRVKNTSLPAPIVNLFKPWHNHLTLLLLSDEINEELWERSLHIIDELVYYFDTNNEEYDRSSLNAWFKKTMPNIMRAIDTTGYDKIKTKKIIEDIEKLIILSFKDNSINEIDQDNIKKDTKEILKEVKPIKSTEEITDEKEESLLDYMKLIEIGSWFEFDNKGRFKIKSFSPKIMRYMLINLAGDKVFTISRLDLARKIQSQQAIKIKTPDQRLFNRALEGIRQHLENEIPVI